MIELSEDRPENSDAVLKSAYGLIGTPFHHGARVPGVGVDCSGLLCCVAKDMGFDFVNMKCYSPVNAFAVMVTEFDAQLTPVDTICIGDVMLFKARLAPGHCGIYVGGNQMIHAHYRRGVVRESLSEYWLR